MKTRTDVVFAIALVLASLSTSSRSQELPVSLKGLWHLDLKRTHTASGPVPKSATLNVSRDDGKIFEAEETWVRPDGSTTTQVSRVLLDGKFYPVAGAPGDLEAAITRWAPGFIRMELRAANGLHGVQVCKISSEPNTMICDELDTDLAGRKSLSRSVYVRGQ